MCDQEAMPWSRRDIPEFPEAARTLDLDTLIKRKEARLAPGQQYCLSWPRPAVTPAEQEAVSPAPEQQPAQANPAPLPNIARLINHDTLVRSATPQASASDEPAKPYGQQPLPTPAKKQRTCLTKTDWKTMDYQDTESE